MKHHSFKHDLYKEWSLWSKSLGKILLICGPQSSGKTTLVYKIIEKVPNSYSINRKALSESITYIIDDIFFSELFKQAAYITGREIKNGHQLHSIKYEEIQDLSCRSQIKDLQLKFLEIISTQSFYQTYLVKLFSAYFNEIKQYIFSGANIIIDEGLINSEEAFSIFHYSCNYYSGIKKVLLFSSIHDTYTKCMIRNKKFVALLDRYSDEVDINATMHRIEIDSGGSSDIYRRPKSIIRNYKEYYDFKTHISVNDVVLEEITKKDTQLIFFKIAIEQLKLLGLLSYKGLVETTTKDRVDIQKELDEIFKGYERVYLVSKISFDYVIDSSVITDLSLLSNTEYVRFLLKDILPWFNGESVDYNTIQSAINRASKFVTIVETESGDALVSKSNCTFNITYFKDSDTLNYEFGNQYKIIVLIRAESVDQLIDDITLAIRSALEQKTVAFLINVDDYWAEAIVRYLPLNNKIQFVYYNVVGKKLEYDPTSLLLISLLYHTIQELKLVNSTLEIIDLTSQRNKEKCDTLLFDEVLRILDLPSHFDCCLIQNLYKEWSIWSQCFGKVIVINSATFSDKAFSLNCLSKLGFNTVSIDDVCDQIVMRHTQQTFPYLLSLVHSFLMPGDLLKIWNKYQINHAKYESWQQELLATLENHINGSKKNILERHLFEREIYDAMYDKAKKFIFSGQNVVIDVVLLNDTIIDLLLYCFHYYPMLIILTSSTLNASFTTTLATKESIYTTTQEDIDLSLRLMVGEILDYDVLHN